MQYMGGKHRQAKYIRETIARVRDGRERYVEPFMGGGSVFAAVAPDFEHATGSDASASLMALWRAVVFDGWKPPESMTQDQYTALRAGDTPTPMRGWAGYAASYQGKWFGGYNGNATHRNYIAENARGIERKAAKLRDHPDLLLTHADYADMVVSADTVVYCDPPYAGTTVYKAADPFDHARFWEVAREWSQAGAVVLVHEYTAPEGWVAVHTRNRVEVMSRASTGARTESLFMLDPSSQPV